MNSSSKTFASVLIAVATIALYWTSLCYPVFFDDEDYFLRNGLNRLFIQGFVFEPRWLPYFATAWVELLFEKPLAIQRGINVGLHLATAFVLYALVKQVSHHLAPHKHNERAAMVAALLFLLHPLAVYAVGYLIQRTILMATLFGLLALNTYFDGLITRKKAYFLFSALFYLLSAFSKEHAVLIPLVALAMTPLAAPVTRKVFLDLALPFALFLAIAVMVVVNRPNVLGQVYEPLATPMVVQHIGAAADSSAEPLWLLSAMTQAALFFKYLLLMFVPNPAWMSVDMRFPFAAHLAEPKYVLGMLALVAYALTALFWLLKGGRRGLAGFALLAPLLLFAVEFSAVRIQEPFVLYRAYLWLPLVFMLVPALTNRIPGKLFWPATLAVALAFSVSSTDRLASFASGYTLWDDAVRKLPAPLASGSARAYNNRGVENLERKNWQAALADFSNALQEDPTYKLAYQNRAFVFLKLGKFGEAIAEGKDLVKRYPQDPGVLMTLGMIYHGAGQDELASATLNKSCEQGSRAACIRAGVIRSKRGQTARELSLI